jgi:tetrahydromethanopterin S-methyltransferase subunit A
MEKKYLEFSEDEAGFMYIYLDAAARNIVVEHYEGVQREVGRRTITSTGKINKVFKGTNAETLYRTILGNGLVKRIDHAAYLGYELSKAETALKNKLKYEQDRPLKIR